MQEGYFAVIAKAQLRDGSYVPTSQLKGEQRKQHRASLEQDEAAFRRKYGYVPGGYAEQHMNLHPGHYGRMRRYPLHVTGRGIKSVYDNHGVGPGIEDAMREDVRDSTTHKNIAYGSSVSPEMEAHLDRVLDPRVVAQTKHTVVFHYGKASTGSLAAAAGRNPALKGTGRVILNHEAFEPHGPMKKKVKSANQGMGSKHVVNHELAHATARSQNPYAWVKADGRLNHLKAYGEEARADARGVLGGEGNYGAKEHKLRDMNEFFHGKSQTNLMWSHYHRVHGKIREGQRVRTPFEMPGAKPKPGWLKITRGQAIGGAAIVGGAGLAVGGKALYDHYHRDHSGKFAPGANPSLRKH